MAKNKFYVVWVSHNPGVYDRWDVCRKEIEGVKGAKYKGFPDRTSAETAFREGPDNYWGKDVAPTLERFFTQIQPFQGVFVDLGVQPADAYNLFKSQVFENGTNNIGEFLAIVHALALQKKNGWNYPIYSDSVNAQLWIKQKKCKTKLQPNAKNAYLFELIARAEKWLNENAIEVPVLKWKTEIWGEIPADFGRK